jgi:murein L,D-transpeptidase YafK
VNKGSSFRIFIDYPNIVDYGRTKKIAGNKSPGGAIFMHGNCVSIGCLSLQNKSYLPVFLLASYHQNNFGSIQIQIFPFRMTNKLITYYSALNQVYNQTYLEDFWMNLKEGYDQFNKTHIPFSMKYLQNKYIFEPKL